jgi:hypothetical protein
LGDEFVGNVLQDLFPSVTETDRWLGREDHAVAENGLAYFGASEYCGILALWVVPKDDDYQDIGGLANHWIDKAWPRVEERYPHRLYRLGTMSNGESVYRKETA